MKKRFFSLAILLLVICICHGQETVTPATALQHYLKNGDTTFHWEVRSAYDIGKVKAYRLELVSQTWRNLRWAHQLEVFVPQENKYDGALLFISGGSVKNGEPNWTGQNDKFMQVVSGIAEKNRAITAVLKQTPNQPLFNNLKEDALISYTLHHFKNDGDYTWPLLFPMVKSAVRAMDAIQEFARRELHHTITRFVVTGASKRGWTTWLTGANDPRVAAIAPMVIDVLNMPVNLDYQMKVWKGYSVQIEDYVKLGIPQTVHSPKGNAITEMVDPYSYRRQLTMPKMIFMGTNDEYWTVDAIKHYYDSIPGQNLIHYVPNAGHDLGDGRQAMAALSAFFGMTMAGHPYPVCRWEVTRKKKGVKLTVKATPGALVDAVIWHADADNMVFSTRKWEGKSLGRQGKASVVVTEKFPESGYRAFYVDLKYKDPNGGTYTESTRMFVMDNKTLFLH